MRYDTYVMLNVFKSVQALHYLDFITLPSTILLRSALLCSTLLSILTFLTRQIRFALLVSIFLLSYLACTLTCIIFSSLYNIILLFLLLCLFLVFMSSSLFISCPPSPFVAILPFFHSTSSLSPTNHPAFPPFNFCISFPSFDFCFSFKVKSST